MRDRKRPAIVWAGIFLVASLGSTQGKGNHTIGLSDEAHGKDSEEMSLQIVTQEVLDIVDTIHADVESKLVGLQERVSMDIQDGLRFVDQELKVSRQRFRKTVLKHVFQQRMGWERLRYSIRDHVGFAIGVTTVFFSHPNLVHWQLALRLQVGQCVFALLEHLSFMNLFQLPHPPWGRDVFVALAGFSVVQAFGSSSDSGTFLNQYLPPIFLSGVLYQSWALILDEWWNVKQPAEKVGIWELLLRSMVACIAVGASLAMLRLHQVPLDTAAKCISGALLIVKSVRNELAGNWVFTARMLLGIIERVLGPVRRVLKWAWKHHRQLTKGLQLAKISKKIRDSLFRPIQSFRTQAVDKVQSAQWYGNVRRSLRDFRQAVRGIWLPWAVALVGLSVQMKWVTHKPQDWIKVIRVALDPFTYVVQRMEKPFNVKMYVAALIRKGFRRIRGKHKEIEASKPKHEALSGRRIKAKAPSP